MTELASLQRGLLALLKERPVETDADLYLERVAASAELALAKEITVWWRAFGLETYCVFTSKLLKRLGQFDQSVEAFFRAGPTSPYIEQLSQDFLSWLSIHDNPFVSSLAQFEWAIIRVKRGDQQMYEVDWDCNPNALLEAILRETELPQADFDGGYRTTISAKIPGFVSCEATQSWQRIA